MAQVIDLNQQENKITQSIVDCAFRVHSKLGPGLLESIYEECLCYELKKKDLQLERQKVLPVQYDDLLINTGLRLDIIVEDKIVLELKSVEKLLPVHEAQIISYLRLSGKPIGFLINFNVPSLKQGLRRFVNQF